MINEKSSATKPVLVFVILLAVIMALVAIIYLTMFKKSSPISVQPAESPTATPIATPVSEMTPASEVDAKEGILLYVSEGDLWQANKNGKENVKLIDNDKIAEAKLSSDKNNIAYTVKKDNKETITTYEGKKEERDFIRYDLFIADRKGANSYLVKDGVMRWDWVPSTDLLWYESSELGQFMDWQYLGKDDIWIFDINDKKSNLLAKDNGILNIKWSFDGSKVLYVGYKTGGNLSLKVINRSTSSKKDLFDIPYVGGDRGGPPPAPSFYWDNNSEFIYTAFTPLLWDKNDELKNKFSSGYLSGWKIPADGSEPVKIFPDVPSAGLNDETYPGVVFNEDFSKVSYTRFKEENLKGLEPNNWFYNDGSIPLSLVVYDIKNQKEKILIENINPKDGINKFWSYFPKNDKREIFFLGNYLYVFTGEKNKNEYESILILKKIDLTTDESYNFEIVLTAKTQYYPRLDNINYSKKQDIIYFVFEDKVICFDVKQQLFEKIIDGVESINFYF